MIRQRIPAFIIMLAVAAAGLYVATTTAHIRPLYAQGSINSDGANPGKERSAKDAQATTVEGSTTVPGEDESAASSISLYDWFVRGGAFMWPILVLAAVGMG
ncbi:MAG: hypothetical protein MUC76_14850, partial [Spirochaetes bacterium]|nr:hypothetical protein [Spirochaetota bacterium]